MTPGLRALAVCLAALAGYVDAIGYLQLGGTFVAFMSGNTTLLGVALGRGDWGRLAGTGSIIGLFVAGVFAASLLRRLVRQRAGSAMLGVVAILLLAAAALNELGQLPPAIAAMALAMGAENVVFERDGKVRLGLTYITGTLVRMAEAMATAVAGGPRWEWAPDLLLWLGLVAGTLAGGKAFSVAGMGALWAGAAAAACLSAASLWLGRSGTRATSGSPPAPTSRPPRRSAPAPARTDGPTAG